MPTNSANLTWEIDKTRLSARSSSSESHTQLLMGMGMGMGMRTSALLALSAASAVSAAERPNLLFLHDESTDGRTYQRDM